MLVYCRIVYLNNWGGIRLSCLNLKCYFKDIKVEGDSKMELVMCICFYLIGILFLFVVSILFI